MQALATDDASEIGLRRVSAWLHEKRTGDRAAARHMLAVQPRGQYSNAAPQWLLEQSIAISTAEHKTKERVEGSNKAADGAAGGKGGKGGKGKEKGKDKNKKGKAPAGGQQPTPG